jgi:hypothetical protein
MRASVDVRPMWVILVLLASLAIVSSGCSRRKYRLQADREAYDAIAERNHDPRWCASNFSIELDPRSRYFDPYNPDRPPLPHDDPASHQYMHHVAGRKGWKHWHANGARIELENDGWYEALPGYVEFSEAGEVKLDVDSAVRLAYVHSPFHQRQLETLYLSSLDVTAERFRLDTQFFGGYDARYSHNGSLIPAGLGYSTLLNRFVITPAIDGPGVENNRLTAGRPFAGDPALQARRRFATAGELLVGFANSFVFEFTGGDANLAASLANFSLIQPLLRGAGKDVALEDLTFDERKLLANLRAYAQFRQGFYTQIAVGELGVTTPQRGGFGTTLLSFSGGGSVGGYLGLLRQSQLIRNSRDNLNLQRRTRDRLEALLENDLIDLVQVDQSRQDVQSAEANLLRLENAYALLLDRFKTNTLGLPPDLPVELDETLIQQFQLVPREATEIQDSVIDLQRRVGQWPDATEVEVIGGALDEAADFIEPVRRLLDFGSQDLARMDEVLPARLEAMDVEDQRRLQRDREQLGKRLADLEQELVVATTELARLEAGLSEQTRAETARRLTSWVATFLRLAERSVLVPARARLESVTVESFELEPQEALQIALANRLDFMNGRAALVDRWRLIQVNADALHSILNVTTSGDIRTARNNPVSFRAPTGSLRAGLEFDAPFTRLLERNVYRESLIEYQQSRREFIQSRDALHLGLRALLRDIKLLRQDLEIQRRAVAIAIRRVDQTQLLLNPPRPAPAPGTRPPINPTTAINLQGAQSSLLTSQNAFLNAWLNYYAARLRLYRELGIMVLDPEGLWVEFPIGGQDDSAPGAENPGPEELPLPPPVPAEWIDLVDFVQPLPDVQPDEAGSEPMGVPAEGRPRELMIRLPPAARLPDTNRYILLQKRD